MNVIDFIAETAKFMAKDRADAYPSVDEAIEELTVAVDVLRESAGTQSVCVFSSYMLVRFVEDGVEEIFMTRQISSLILFEEEEVCRAYGWVPSINLDNPLDDGLDE